MDIGRVRGSVKLLITLLLMLICVFVPASMVSAGVTVRNAEWEGKGRVEVHFNEKIEYCGVKILVWDPAGKGMKKKIIERHESEIEFIVGGMKPGTKYTYLIQGLRQKGCTRIRSVSGSFTVPKPINGITVTEEDYDNEKKLASFEFLEEVEWKNPKVSITCGGKEHVLGIKKKTPRDIVLKVSKLTAGRTYRWKIFGIRKKGTSKYVTLSGTFKAF